MRICYFGTYSDQEGYPMNEVLIRGLRENQVEVVECRVNLWKGRMEKVESVRKGLFSKVRLLLRYCLIYASLSKKFFRMDPYDAIIVGYPGHFDFFVAKLLNSIHYRRPIVINLLFSLYDTVVMDRKLVPSRSLLARMIWRIDRRVCLWADRVILDTYSHIDFFRKEFGIPGEKFLRVHVGADDFFFKPGTPPENPHPRHETQVLFFGTYIPLHGVETILRAAHELKPYPDIRFTLIGSGQTYNEMRMLADNLGLTCVTFISSWVGYSELSQYIQNADICLGAFGTTEKGRRVIPCKVYNCLAMGKPLITADSPASREILKDGVNALLCPPGDPHSLASSILKLRNNPKLRANLGKAGFELFRTTLSPKQIGRDLKEVLEKMV